MIKHIYNLVLVGISLLFFLMSRVFHNWYLETPVGSSEESLANMLTDAMIVGFVATMVLLGVSVAIQSVTAIYRMTHDEMD